MLDACLLLALNKDCWHSECLNLWKEIIAKAGGEQMLEVSLLILTK
jgi:hypothetical protein